MSWDWGDRGLGTHGISVALTGPFFGGFPFGYQPQRHKVVGSWALVEGHHVHVWELQCSGLSCLVLLLTALWWLQVDVGMIFF